METIGTLTVLAFNRADSRGLVWNIGIALLSVLLINGLIALVNPLAMTAYQQSSLTPPGYVIGIVWTGLFVCLGLARWYLIRRLDGDTVPSATPIVSLAVLCLAYPVYTGCLRSETIGLIGNIVTLVFTVGVIASVFPRSRAAALWITPTAIWLTYATFLTVLSVRSR